MKQSNSGTKPRSAEAREDTIAAELARFPSLRPKHPLEAIFQCALEQARNGKGEERHGHGVDFMKQPWLEISNAHGIGFLTGQAEKKLRESMYLQHEQRRRELLGVIVYAAMAVIKLDRDRGESTSS